MAAEQAFPFSVTSLVENVLQQDKVCLSDVGLASRKAEETSLRRYEAAGWLRKSVGVVGGKDLPAEPSDEEFRLGLRSGIILCNVLNKVRPGSVPKVVEGPIDSSIIPDGAALSAYQYFENIRNFLVALAEIGIPTFEASDLEQGGNTARIVKCVLALKSYCEWKRGGGHGLWKFGGNLKPPIPGTNLVRGNSEPFMRAFKNLTSERKSLKSLSYEMMSQCHHSDDEINGCSSQSMNMLVHELLSDKKQEEIPSFVESMLNIVMEEFERQLSTQVVMKDSSENVAESRTEKSLFNISGDINLDEDSELREMENCDDHMTGECEPSKKLKLIEEQQRNIKELKHNLHNAKLDLQLLKTKYHEEFNSLGKHLHGLTHAASEYQRVIEENRKLYNQVQDLKGNIRVYCRVRPFLPGHFNRASTIDHIEEGNIIINTPGKYGKEGRKAFCFNKVFGPRATQEEVFADTQPLIRSVLDGYNVCIFAYGQTGSGKTYTMTGPNELTNETLGVNYRALSDFFLLLEQRKETMSYDISVQMLEIYNEQVRDLLVMDGANKRLEIRNHAQNGLNVPDASRVPVSSTSDVIHFMKLGESNRAMSATAMNERSSRSHSCLTVHVQGRYLTSGSIIHGCMHLVDLAGSERVEKSEVTGDRLKEAQYINRSLSALGDVISSLAHKNSHVPYRNSKLTQLLQDSLGGQAKTLMFVHVSPEPEAIGETISTLKFAERVSMVELGAARVNKDTTNVKQLKDQIANLKAALGRKETASQNLSAHSRASTPERNGKQYISYPSWKSAGDWSSDKKQALDDLDITKAQESPLKPRRRSLDVQEMLRNSPPFPLTERTDISRNMADEDKESVSGDWIDKVMVNKQESTNGDENSIEHWKTEKVRLAEMNGRHRSLNFSRIYPENMENKCPSTKNNQDDTDVNGRHWSLNFSRIYPENMENKCPSTKNNQDDTDDSDDLDATTSDSLEAEISFQSNHVKVTNGLPLKTKKTNQKQARTAKTRSLIPSLIPPPSRKIIKGSMTQQPQHRLGRQVSVVEVKRKAGSVK